MRLKQRRIVDFPQPEGPISAVISSAKISRSTERTAWTSPYQTSTPFAFIFGGLPSAPIGRLALRDPGEV